MSNDDQDIAVPFHSKHESSSHLNDIYDPKESASVYHTQP